MATVLIVLVCVLIFLVMCSVVSAAWRDNPFAWLVLLTGGFDVMCHAAAFVAGAFLGAIFGD